METRFLVKVQKVGGQRGGEVSIFSSPLVIEPEGNVEAKRGNLYAVVEASCSNRFDPAVVLKMVVDELQSGYFGSDQGTPLQSLENAITKVREKAVSIISGDKVLDPSARFNAVMAVLWGSVLYIVQYGSGCSYLIREGRIKPVNAISEGDFSIASGMVKEGDIVILGSTGFCESNPPEILLKGSSSFIDKPEISAVVLKFHVEREEPLKERKIEIKEPATLDIKVRKGRSVRLDRRKRLLITAAVVGFLLVASSVFAFKKASERLGRSNVEAVLTGVENSVAEASKLIGSDDERARALLSEALTSLEKVKDKMNSERYRSLREEIEKKIDEVNRLRRITPEALYDLRIDEKEINPSEIFSTALDSALVVDYSNSKFYKLLTTASPLLTPVESTEAANPRFLSYAEIGAFFVGRNGFYLFDGGKAGISKLDVSIDYPMSEVKAASYYIGNVYTIRDNTIFKNSIGWSGSDTSLSDVVSMAIDGDIYLLKKNGEVARYKTGSRDSYGVKGLQPPLSDPVQIFTSFEHDGVYVLDRGSARVVALDKEGNLKSQYTLVLPDSSPQDLRAMTISRDEKSAFLLWGTKVFKFDL